MDNMGKILKGLLKRTEGGQLKWTPSLEGTSFVAAVDAIAVSITAILTGVPSQSDRHRLEVFNDQGIPVESLESPARFGFPQKGQKATDEQDGEMSRLFTLARRSALDTDSTLRKLVDSLENSP